jgi:opacity protein-like surface antigen
MRRLLLATAAAVVIATPAAAKDNSGYIGLEGGILFPQKQDIDASIDFTDPLVTDVTFDDVARIKYKKGYDVDLIGGYDFGMFRVEGELGYKRAKTKSLQINDAFLTGINTPSGNSFTSFDLNGRTSVLSGMVNALLDFGDDTSFSGSVGGGFGRARVKELGDSDSAWAWQLIAGARMPVSSNIDVGLKYRYFRTGKLNFHDEFAFTPVGTTCGTVPCSGGTAFFDASDKFQSHSVLLSLIYNFAAAEAPPPPPESAPPPPPPPPAPPATQTCPDGSVILATSTCPAPPPPPPPPPTERGERGN